MVPVVLGVAITTVTEAEFALFGFVSAVVSTIAQALQTVISKQVLCEREVCTPCFAASHPQAPTHLAEAS